jgi:hypothetical protein
LLHCFYSRISPPVSDRNYKLSSISSWCKLKPLSIIILVKSYYFSDTPSVRRVQRSVSTDYKILRVFRLDLIYSGLILTKICVSVPFRVHFFTKNKSLFHSINLKSTLRQIA